MKPLVWEDPKPGPGRKSRARLELLRKAADRKPDDAVLHLRVGGGLLEAGATEEAEVAFRRALEVDGSSPEAALGLGRALAEEGRLEEALRHLSAAAAVLPERFAARYHFGRTLARADRPAEALTELRAAARLEPRHFHALHNLVRLHLIRGRPEEALAELEGSLARVPGNAAALGLEGQVLTEMGRTREAAELRAFGRLLRSYRPGAPEGWSDPHAFIGDLADSVRAHESLEYEPRGRSTRGGSQAGLSGSGTGPEAALFRRVQAVVEEYREVVASGPDHPLLDAVPERARLDMWTVVLREGGHQVPHIHPQGWVSGVYYVKVPAGGPEVAGPIEFGGRDHLLPLEAPPRTRTVMPEEGLLLLFPSFYYHRTVPTRTDEERICVAFDMVPVR